MTLPIDASGGVLPQGRSAPGVTVTEYGLRRFKDLLEQQAEPGPAAALPFTAADLSPQRNPPRQSESVDSMPAVFTAAAKQPGPTPSSCVAAPSQGDVVAQLEQLADRALRQIHALAKPSETRLFLSAADMSVRQAILSAVSAEGGLSVALIPAAEGALAGDSLEILRRRLITRGFAGVSLRLGKAEEHSKTDAIEL